MEKALSWTQEFYILKKFMATITIENVPQSFIEKYTKTTFSFEEVALKPKKVFKDPTIEIQKKVEDPSNKRFGPFDNVEAFLEHLHSNSIEVWK